MPESNCLSEILASLVGPTAAAWFQAVGSLAALYVAFTVGKRQADAAIAAATEGFRRQDESRRKSIMAIAGAAMTQAGKIEKSFEKGTPADMRQELYFTYDQTIVDGMVRAITNVPFHEVGSSDGVIALLSMGDQFVFLGKAMKVFLDGHFSDPLAMEALKGIDDLNYKRKVIETWDTARVSNAKRHLDQIKKDYEAFMSAMQ